jgi:hypothetical protein
MKAFGRSLVLERLAAGGFLACSLVAGAKAQAPSGSFEYEFPGDAGLLLWNLGGNYSLPCGVAQLQHRANGGVTACYTALAPEGTSVMLSGTVNQTGTNLVMRLRSTVAVPENLIAEQWPLGQWLQRKDTFTLSFNSANNQLSGSDRVSRTEEHLIYYTPGSLWEGSHTKIERTTTVSYQTVSFSAPPTADGSWRLSFNMVPAGNKLSGSASVLFANSKTYQFRLQGRYMPRNGKTKLVLIGEGLDKGARLLLALSGPGMGIESLTGTLAGQRLRFRSSYVQP